MRCKACNVEIITPAAVCPLCGGPLDGTGEKLTPAYPEFVEKRKHYYILRRILLFFLNCCGAGIADGEPAVYAAYLVVCLCFYGAFVCLGGNPSYFPQRRQSRRQGSRAGCLRFAAFGLAGLGNGLARLVGQLCAADCLLCRNTRRYGGDCRQPNQLGALCDVSGTSCTAGLCSAGAVSNWCGKSALGGVYSGFTGRYQFSHAGSIWRPKH